MRRRGVGVGAINKKKLEQAKLTQKGSNNHMRLRIERFADLNLGITFSDAPSKH